MLDERPNGVKGVSLLGVGLACAALLYAVLIAAGQTPLSAGAWLLGGGFEQLGALAFLLYAALLVLLAAAVWFRWRLARRATMLLAVAGIAFAVPAISSAVADARVFAIAREGLQIIVRVLIVFYLSQEPVKDWFAGG
ncbi:MAG TPA: hypothetical protein VE779_08940 [Candidatus Angelobacter sp.]|jgi:hypothetical protein|nr:hypothetical protein [Candidatus Angelobacter sp.]